MTTRKIGRDASTGRFISVREAKHRPSTTTVESVPGTTRRGRRRAVRSITEENQNERPSNDANDI